MEIPFSSSPRATLGVEWELMLVDRTTRDLRGEAVPVLADMVAARGLDPAAHEHPKAKQELLQNTVEIITGICTTVSDATWDLQQTVDELRMFTDPRGHLMLLAAGIWMSIGIFVMRKMINFKF